jgi:hypothetical protein
MLFVHHLSRSEIGTSPINVRVPQEWRAYTPIAQLNRFVKAQQHPQRLVSEKMALKRVEKNMIVKNIRKLGSPAGTIKASNHTFFSKTQTSVPKILNKSASCL